MKNIFKSKEERQKLKLQKQLESAKLTTRKPDEIAREYNSICAEAGDKQYRVKVMSDELEKINQRLFQLNQEFHRASTVHGQQQSNNTAPSANTEAQAQAPVKETAQNEAQLQ